MAVKLFYHGDDPANAAGEDGPIRRASRRQQRLELDVMVGPPPENKPGKRTLGNKPSLLREPIMGNIQGPPGPQTRVIDALKRKGFHVGGAQTTILE